MNHHEAAGEDVSANECVDTSRSNESRFLVHQLNLSSPPTLVYICRLCLHNPSHPAGQCHSHYKTDYQGSDEQT